MKLKKTIINIVAAIGLTTLTSCGTLDGTIDKGVVGGKELVSHTTNELKKLKTETLQEVEETIEEVMPQMVDTLLNTEAVAFLIVSVTLLLSLVVIVALILLLGTARVWWRRLVSAPN